MAHSATQPAIDPQVQFRLRVFWGRVVFSLGILWGISNVVYCPVAAMTSIVGSSWLEVLAIFVGGVLTTVGSIAAFYRFKPPSMMLLTGGVVLLLIAIFGQTQVVQPFDTRGPLNLALLFLAGLVPIALGLFGWTTGRMGWPSPRSGN